jgi:hypothetical protein
VNDGPFGYYDAPDGSGRNWFSYMLICFPMFLNVFPICLYVFPMFLYVFPIFLYVFPMFLYVFQLLVYRIWREESKFAVRISKSFTRHISVSSWTVSTIWGLGRIFATMSTTDAFIACHQLS